MHAARFSVPFTLLIAILIGCGKKADSTAPLDNQRPGDSKPKDLEASTQSWSPPNPPAATDADKAQFEALKMKKGVKAEPDNFYRVPGGYYVEFGSEATDEDFKSLSGLKPITHISIQYGRNITAAGIKGLKDLEFLRTLTIQHCEGITNAGVENLDRFPNLIRLDLSANSLGDAALVEIAKLKHLTYLQLNYNPKITDAGMVHISKLTTLEDLSIMDSQVSDEGLKSLKGLRELTVLYLARTKITDTGLDALDFPKLKRLALNGTGITDDGVAKLAKLPSLSNLNLSDCQVTDKCLGSLKKFPKLHRATLYQTKVTRAAADAFEKESPGITIDAN